MNTSDIVAGWLVTEKLPVPLKVCVCVLAEGATGSVVALCAVRLALGLLVVPAQVTLPLVSVDP